jgi:hypothetical protein
MEKPANDMSEKYLGQPIVTVGGAGSHGVGLPVQSSRCTLKLATALPQRQTKTNHEDKSRKTNHEENVRVVRRSLGRRGQEQRSSRWPLLLLAQHGCMLRRQQRRQLPRNASSGFQRSLQRRRFLAGLGQCCSGRCAGRGWHRLRTHDCGTTSRGAFHHSSVRGSMAATRGSARPALTARRRLWRVQRHDGRERGLPSLCSTP